MSAWKGWRKRKYEPVIRQHEKELPRWRSASHTLFMKILNYPNSKLATIATFGFIGVLIVYTYRLKLTQRRWHREPYTVLALEKFRDQKKLLSLVGEPIRFGWIQPSQKDAVREDYVDLLIPIEGSKAEGVLSLEAHKVADSWIVDDLNFEFVDTAGGVVQIIKNES